MCYICTNFGYIYAQVFLLFALTLHLLFGASFHSVLFGQVFHEFLQISSKHEIQTIYSVIADMLTFT